MSRRQPAPLDDLDALVADIIVDAYGDDEPQIAFLEVFNQEVSLPAAATVLGMPVEVVGFDYLDDRHGIVAECRREATHQPMAVVDLTFPPDSVARGCRPPIGAGSASSHTRTRCLSGGGRPGCDNSRISCPLWSVE